MTSELRDAIAKIIIGYDPENDHPYDLAARILALPGIAESRAKAKRWDKASMDALDD